MAATRHGRKPAADKSTAATSKAKAPATKATTTKSTASNSKITKHPSRAASAKPAALKAAANTKATRAPAHTASTKSTTTKSVTKTNNKSTAKSTAKTTTKSTKASTKSTIAKKRASPVDEDGDTEPSNKRVKTEDEPKPRKKPLRKAKSPAPRVAINNSPVDRLEVFVFGTGSAGELGLGAGKGVSEIKRPRLNPFLKADEVGIVQMDCGGMHNVALAHDGNVYTWGVNDAGTLGRDTNWDGGLRDVEDEDSDSDSDGGADLNPKEATPATIDLGKFPEGTRITQVVAGDSVTFLLTDTGDVWGWGQFRDGNGPYGFTYDTKAKEIVKLAMEPMQIAGLKNITKLSVGADFVLALDNKGVVWAWGTGQQDQLGRRLVDRRRYEALIPQKVGFPRGTGKIVDIFTGSNHAFAISDKGNSYAWGLNNFGQCGITSGAGEGGNTVIVPKRISALDGRLIKHFAGGSHHSLAVDENGEVLTWGRIDGNQLGHDLATLPIDDEDVVMSSNGRPRILLEPTVLPTIHGAIYGEAGPENNIVVTKNGKAYTWGFNATYQCGQGTDDDIILPTMIDNTATRDKKLTWAGAGGQYAVVAAPSSETLPNGVH